MYVTIPPVSRKRNFPQQVLASYPSSSSRNELLDSFSKNKELPHLLAFFVNSMSVRLMQSELVGTDPQVKNPSILQNAWGGGK